MAISLRTVYKLRNRYRAEGLAGLKDRSSWPIKSPGRTPDNIAGQIVKLRRRRRVMDRIAQETGGSRATVARILRRLGLNRWRILVPTEPVQR